MKRTQAFVTSVVGKPCRGVVVSSKNVVDVKPSLSLTAASHHMGLVGDSTARRVETAPSAARLANGAQPDPPSPPGKPSRILFWFRHDLRVCDNEALRAAADASAVPGGALVPVVVGVKRQALPLTVELGREMVNRGSQLIALRADGDVAKRLIDTCDKLKLRAVYFNRAMDGESAREEARVESALRDAGIQVESFWGNSLFTPTQSQLQNSTSHKSSKKSPTSIKAVYNHAVAHRSEVTTCVSSPESLPAIPPAAATLEQTSLPTHAPGAGTSAALKILESMDKRRETLLLSRAADLVVLLKPHLDFGSISLRMVAARVEAVLGKLHGKTFSELVWRTYVSFAAHRSVGTRSTVGATAV